jgi:hypothetical protein
MEARDHQMSHVTVYIFDTVTPNIYNMPIMIVGQKIRIIVNGNGQIVQ